jgi:hypothetical protein
MSPSTSFLQDMYEMIHGKILKNIDWFILVTAIQAWKGADASYLDLLSAKSVIGSSALPSRSLETCNYANMMQKYDAQPE